MNMFKSNGGFTLVELIVVIAILAILAGIAIPAYSGYIAKAQEAGDTQIISAVNTAIQAAKAAKPDATFTADYNNGVVIAFDDTAVQGNYDTFIGDNDVVFEYYTDVAINTTTGLVEGVK